MLASVLMSDAPMSPSHLHLQAAGQRQIKPENLAEMRDPSGAPLNIHSIDKLTLTVTYQGSRVIPADRRVCDTLFYAQLLPWRAGSGFSLMQLGPLQNLRNALI
eukprot:TRINITY_DN10051_c0_g1_i5.p1 TRINITY_DN10051_c0_g1~~TRINITY_DN10051_c0_g1_i5.p1  ORF type:complete len:104 (+),score=2.66 TRINITY_DN10051_c0_g1_i5:146-457(+)